MADASRRPRSLRHRLAGFEGRLVAIALLGFALRAFYALHYAPDLEWGDGVTYHLLANLLADGHGFIGAQQYILLGRVQPTAEHPPLYPLVLAAPSLVGLTSWTAHRLVSCALGAATIWTLGVLGRRVDGEAAGLLAAAIAAVYPLLIIPQGMVASEALYGLLVALALLAALNLADRPSGARAALLGGAVGLAALTRSEALLFVPLLILPLTLRAADRRWRNAALACGVTALVIAPWTARSSLALDRPVVLSTNVGGLLAGANCDTTYYTGLKGLWWPRCWSPTPPGADEGEVAGRLQRQGIDYARDHGSRLPAIAAIRVLRAWDLYQPDQGAVYERLVDGRHFEIEQVGVRIYYVLVALGIVGIVALRDRRGVLAILLAPVVLVTVTAALTYGITRLRMAAEMPLVIFAATGLLTAQRWVALRISRARER